jgi:hypothetical protein
MTLVIKAYHEGDAIPSLKAAIAIHEEHLINLTHLINLFLASS